jgi:hypothetical protein
METLDIKQFITFKTDNETLELDKNIFNLFKSIFNGIDKNKKNKKFVKKVNTNILKNQTIQNNKDIISNKINLILNKLSESNIDNLIIEFIQNINQVDIDTFNEIQKTFYLKIISEINFVKIYIKFLKIIGYLYNKVQGYQLSYFYSIIESKFKSDYNQQCIIPSDLSDFIKNIITDQTHRINNLIIINNLIDNNMLSKSINDYCDNIIMNQEIYISDIYHWFNLKNRQLTENEINNITIILGKNICSPRDIILLENLINKTINTVSKLSSSNIQTTIPTTQNVYLIKSEAFNNQCINILEEYLIGNILDDIKYFIDSVCIDTNTKNKFCEYLFQYYFITKPTNIENKDSTIVIFDLIKQIIKNQYLFKSNLSKGLLLFNNTWKTQCHNYTNSINKMKKLLLLLKNAGITKGIEFLLNQYKI